MSPRGGSARNRRSQRRAESRSQQQGVNEALALTAAAAMTAEELREASRFDESLPDDVAEDFAELARLAAVEEVAVEETAGIRDEFRRALVATGLVESDATPLTTTYDLSNGTLGDRKFLASAIEAGFNEARRAQWPSEATLGDHGTVLYRDSTEGVFALDDGTVVYASIAHGWCSVRVAAATRDKAAGTLDVFSATYPPLYREEAENGTIVPITFWTNTRYGPSSRLRMIDSSTWSDIEGNYTGKVRDELERLMSSFEPGKDGQLLLWQGTPGTGKTWALRALASEWKDWAEFSYITDPDAFFVSDPAYMIDVLLHESYENLSVDGDVVTDVDPDGKWRILILEDTGELMSANAKADYGQGLSRLLNVVDGMIGQGLRVLAIITTNDELGDLHPAAVRPGRCASQLSFGPLSADESTAWLHAHDIAQECEAEMSLAELYEFAGQQTVEAFADAMTGTCANCDHAAMAHEGDMNDGACSVEGCSCGSFEEMSEQAAAEPVEASASEALVTITPLFTSSGKHAASLSQTQSGRMTFTLTEFTPLPVEFEPGESLPGSSQDIIDAPQTAAVGAFHWSAIFAPEGTPTDDGRIFAPGSITWRELPLTLMAMLETQDGHNGAQVCGRIDRIWRDEAAGLIRAEGEFDTGEFGAEIARLVDEKVLGGISVDIAVSEMEIAYRSSVLNEDGKWAESEDGAQQPDMLDTLFGGEGEPVIFVVRKGVIGASTVCPFPAFAEAKIELGSSLAASIQAPMVWTVTSQAGFVVTQRSLVASAGLVDLEALAARPEEEELGESLTASAAGIAPETPPAEWFADPEFDELTPLTVDEDGRIFGHAAAWDTCHIGIPGVCTTAPESHSDYAYFHLKEVVCDDGSRIACGTITLDTNHAGRNAGRVDAAAHYDNTGTQAADIVVGEDEHGIWFAGALRADVDAGKARKLRGSVLSGDWRDVNGNLELVGLLAVNVPGFPVPRTRALVASGENHEAKVLSLIAAGVHVDGHTRADLTVVHMPQEDIDAITLIALSTDD